MAMQVSSFFKKTYTKVRSAPIAFAFLLIALLGTFLAFAVSKSVMQKEGEARFMLLTQELRAVVVSRVNRTIDLPVAIAKSIDTSATKGELDAYMRSLNLETRYPGVREVGIYALSGQSLKRFYHYGVDGEANSISESELKSVVAAEVNANSTEPFMIKIKNGDVRYVILVPIEQGSYFFTVFDATSVLGRLFVENSIFNNIDFKIYDTVDQDFPLYESDALPFSEKKYTYQQSQQVKLGLYPWSLVAAADHKQLLSGTAQRMPIVILISGIAIALLVFGILWALSWSRKSALVLAEDMTKSLRESEEKYRSIFESLQDVYYRTDKNGMITTVSPSVEHYTGLKPEILIGKPAAAFYQNPEECDAMLAELARNGVVKDYPLTLVGASGKVVFCSLNARFVAGPNGSMLGVEGLIRDVSERKKATDALEARTKELERLNNLMVGRELRMVELKEELKRYGKN